VFKAKDFVAAVAAQNQTWYLQDLEQIWEQVLGKV
jgi:hypothetical protein